MLEHGSVFSIGTNNENLGEWVEAVSKTISNVEVMHVNKLDGILTRYHYYISVWGTKKGINELTNTVESMIGVCCS